MIKSQWLYAERKSMGVCIAVRFCTFVKTFTPGVPRCPSLLYLRLLVGFFFSSYSQTASSQPALIRMDQYLSLYTQAATVSNTTLDLSTGPPKQMLLVRFRDDISDNQRTDVSDGLRCVCSFVCSLEKHSISNFAL